MEGKLKFNFDEFDEKLAKVLETEEIVLEGLLRASQSELEVDCETGATE